MHQVLRWLSGEAKDGCGGQKSSVRLLLVHLSLVELEFLTLKDVAVSAADLTGARGDASEESSTLELVSNLRLDNSGLLDALQLGLNVTGLLSLFSHLVRLFDLLGVKLDVVLAEVVETEGVRIDRDDSVLHDGLRSHKLVVGRVVDGIEDLALLGDGLRSPVEVTSINAQSSELVVATSAADRSNTSLTKLGHGRLSAHFELSLLLVNGHAARGGSSLVP